ncbi:MAG: hypothetical protein FJY97_15140 [candidate division Zixibacteria bacterium]|nr:hypothetical protein [candidate division Zixibacteria bacterium]
MEKAVDVWLEQAEARIAEGGRITETDLRTLADMLRGRQQHLLYVWADSDHVESGVISWNYFGPFSSEYRFDPKNECPYKNVKTAMADGWRIVSFPAVEYPLHNAHTQLGHQFILERFFSPGEGLPITPHGARKPEVAG